MTTLFKMLFLAFALATLGCSNKQHFKKKASSVKMQDSISVVTTQTNFDTIGKEKLISFKQVPKFIVRYLDSLSGKKFAIADPGESFATGCIVFQGEKTKQFIWAVLGKDSFQMEYWQGGIALHKRHLILSLQNENVVAYKYDN